MPGAPMSSTVRIPVAAAVFALRELKEAQQLEPGIAVSTAIRGIEQALASLKRKSEKKRPRREAKKQKRLSAKERRADVREQVMARAGDKCECGCGQPFTELEPAEMDHFFGRSQEHERTCWALRRDCHRAKTLNVPNHVWWLERFHAHARGYGYWGAAELARARLDALALTAEAEQLTITAKNPTIDLGPMRAALSRKEGA